MELRQRETFEELVRSTRGDEDYEALSRDTDINVFMLRQFKNGLAAQPQMVTLQRIASVLRVPFRRVDAAVWMNRLQRDPQARATRQWRPLYRSHERLQLRRLIGGVPALITVGEPQIRERWRIRLVTEHDLPEVVLRTIEADASVELADVGAQAGQPWLVDFDAMPRAVMLAQPSSSHFTISAFPDLTSLALALGIEKGAIATRLAIAPAELRALDAGCADLPPASAESAAQRLGTPCSADVVRSAVTTAQRLGGPSAAMLERIRAFGKDYAAAPLVRRSALFDKHFPDPLERGQVCGPDRYDNFFWKPVTVHVAPPSWRVNAQ